MVHMYVCNTVVEYRTMWPSYSIYANSTYDRFSIWQKIVLTNHLRAIANQMVKWSILFKALKSFIRPYFFMYTIQDSYCFQILSTVLSQLDSEAPTRRCLDFQNRNCAKLRGPIGKCHMMSLLGNCYAMWWCRRLKSQAHELSHNFGLKKSNHR